MGLAMERRLISTKELARLLGVSVTTIERWRSSGKGPAWIRMGDRRTSRVLYDRADVALWINQHKEGNR